MDRAAKVVDRTDKMTDRTAKVVDRIDKATDSKKHRAVAAATLHNAFAQSKHVAAATLHNAFAQSKHVAAASLSRKKHLLLPLRFRAKNICCCRFAFAQKTSVGPSGSTDAPGNRPVGKEINLTLL
ncbi:hypothetical protein [Lysinibacillus sp. NPDC093216]|uniref:hypothetical protein n=1 Tax=Lysinibacillus sp. NPDC093216 TaxID=3390576 RepID=UPI003D07D82A